MRPAVDDGGARPHIWAMDISEYPLLDEPSLMLDVLKTAAKGPATVDECLRRLEGILKLIGEPLPEDRAAVRQRLEAAVRYLYLAALIDREDNSERFVITPRGEETLRTHPDGVDLSVLAEFPDFRSYIRRSRESTRTRDAGLPVIEPTAAYRDGYAAYGENRDISDNPHPLDTAAHLEWENGWSEAREEALRNERAAG